MLKVKPFRQRPGHCGPASVKMVLDYYGAGASERALGALMKCTASHGVTDARGFLKAAKAHGFRAFIKDFCCFEDLSNYIKKGIPVIVHWYSADEGHFSVVVHLTSTHIFLQDPEIGHIRKVPSPTFKRVWFGFRDSRDIRSMKDLIVRRMIVILPR